MDTTIQIMLSVAELKLIVSESVQEAFLLSKNQAEKNHQDSFLTRDETAKILGITLPTLRTYSLQGKIKAYRIGSRIRYKQSELESSLKAFFKN